MFSCSVNRINPTFSPPPHHHPPSLHISIFNRPLILAPSCVSPIPAEPFRRPPGTAGIPSTFRPLIRSRPMLHHAPRWLVVADRSPHRCVLRTLVYERTSSPAPPPPVDGEGRRRAAGAEDGRRRRGCGRAARAAGNGGARRGRGWRQGGGRARLTAN